MASVGVGIKRKTDQESKYEKKKRKKSYTLNGSDGLRPKNCPLSERQQLALVMQLSAEQSSASPSSPIAKKNPGNSSKKDKVNKINTRGETALHLATIKGDLSQIKDLISKGADINSSDYAGWTPLHEACNRGYRDIAEFLLLAGARVNPKGYRDDYPLHDAVNNNHIEVVKLLMMHGANPQLPNSDGLRPLDIKMPKKMKKILMGEWSSKQQQQQQTTAPQSHHHHQQQQQRHYNSKPKEFDSKQQKLDCQLSSSHKRIKKHKSKGEDRNKSDSVGNSSSSSSRKQLYSSNNNNGGGVAASSSSTTFSSPPYSNDDFSKSSSDLEDDDRAEIVLKTTGSNGCRANKENNNNSNSSGGGVSSKLTAVAQATVKNNNIHSDMSEISDDEDHKISSSSSESSASASSSDEMYNSNLHKKCGKKWMREELMSSFTTSRNSNNGKSLMMKSNNDSGDGGKLTSGGLLSFDGGGGKSLLSDHYGSPPSTPDVYDFSPGEEDSPNKLATIMLRNGVKSSVGKQRDHVTHHHHHHHHPATTTIKSAIDRPPIVSFAYDEKQSGKKLSLDAGSLGGGGGKWKKKNKRSSSKDSGSDSTTSSSASFVLTNKNNNYAKLNGLFAETNGVGGGGGKPSIYSSPTPFLAMHHEKMLKSTTPVVVAKRNTSTESPSLTLEHHQQQQRTKPKHVNEMETVMNSANHRNSSVKLKEKLSKSCSDPTAKSKPTTGNNNNVKECRKPSASVTVVAVKSPVNNNNHHHHHHNGTTEPQATTMTPNSKKSVSLLDTPLEFLSDFDTPYQKRVKKKKKCTSQHKHQRPAATVTLPSPSSSTPQKAAVRLSESTPWFLTAKASTPDNNRTKATAAAGAVGSCGSGVKRTARSVSLNTPSKKLPDSCTSARLLSDNQVLGSCSNSNIDTALSTITAENNSTAASPLIITTANHHHQQQQQRDDSDGENVRTSTTTTAEEDFAPTSSNGSRDPIAIDAVEVLASETKVEPLVKTEFQTATTTTTTEEEEVIREEPTVTATTDAPTITTTIKVEDADDDDKSVDDASADAQSTCATDDAAAAADVEVVENGDQAAAATQLQPKQEKAETAAAAADDDDNDDDDDDDESDNDEELREQALREQRQKEEDSYKARIEKEKNEYQMLLNEYLLQKHSAPAVLVDQPTPLPVYFPPSTLMHKKMGHHRRSNSYVDRFKIDQIVNEKRRRLTPIVSKAPDHFWEFLTFTGRYRLHGHKASELSIPLVNPPSHLDLPMQELFVMHEGARTRLRIRHVIEREKVVLSCEQEILRVHARAARTIHNQQIPYSACSYLLDAEVYKLPSLSSSLCGSAAVTTTTTTAGDRRGVTAGENENSSKGSIRDRFNKRTFTSWMQDVVDKFTVVKSSMLARQKHEAAALLAVQRCEWSLKMRDIKIINNRGTDIPIDKIKDEVVDECCVPLVNIGDDFKLLPKTP